MLAAGIDVDLDRQHPAPREPERRDRRAHRGARPRDVSRPGARGAPTRSCSSTSRPRRCRSGCGPARSTRPSARSVALDNFFRDRPPLGAARAGAARGRRGRRSAPPGRRCSTRSASRRWRSGCSRWSTPRAALAADPAACLALGRAARRPARRALGAARAGRSSARTSRSQLAALRRLAVVLGAHFLEEEGDDLVAHGPAGRRASAARPMCFVGTPDESRVREILRGSLVSRAGARAARRRHPRGREPRRPRGARTVIPARSLSPFWLSIALAAAVARSPAPAAAARATPGRGGGSWCRSPGALDPTVLDAAIRIARAEEAVARSPPTCSSSRCVPRGVAAHATRSRSRCRCSRRSSLPRCGPAYRSTRGSRKAAR